MSTTRIPRAKVPPDSVTGVEGYAVGDNGEYFAVGRRCRHLRADLAEGSIDADGCLVCPWHQAKYDVKTGRMTRGPQGVFAKIPGLDAGVPRPHQGVAAPPRHGHRRRGRAADRLTRASLRRCQARTAVCSAGTDPAQSRPWRLSIR